MAISEEALVQKIAKLEARSSKHPTLYKAKVAVIVIMGYAMLLWLILGSLGLFAGLIEATIRTEQPFIARLALIPLFIGLIVIRAIWVKLPTPEGNRVSRESAPDLHGEVEEIRRALGVAPLDAVLVDRNLNAAVVEQPRFLGFLGSRRYLLVGLPLLALVSREQFRAILAHEFGHLSGRHGRFTSWVYRIRSSWDAIQAQAKRSRNIFVRLLGWYLEWYVPVIHSNTFVLARRQEYEADRCAAELTSAEKTGEALVASDVYGEIFGDLYWKHIFEGIKTSPEPTVRPFSDIRSCFKAILRDAVEQDYLKKSLEKESDISDVHPCLSDRLTALGLGKPLPVQWPDDPAINLLGSQADRLAAEFDSQWHDAVAPEWRKRYAAYKESCARLEGYEQAGVENLDEQELQDFAALAQEHGSEEKSARLYQVLLERSPENAAANFNVGIVRLKEKDESGIAMLEKAMQADHRAVQPGCRVLYEYYKDAGREDEAEKYAERWRAQQTMYEKANQERRHLSVHDVYKQANLTEMDIQALRDALGKFPWIAKAYLVEKDLKYMRQSPLFLVGIRSRWRKPKGNVAKLVRQQIRVSQQLTVVDLDKLKKFRRKFKRVKSSAISL